MSDFNVSEVENFCRVFEIPRAFPNEYCFNGGHRVNFQMVDWFHPIPMEDIYSNNLQPWGHYEAHLKEWVLKKSYIKDDMQYIVITDFGKSEMIALHPDSDSL